MMRKRKGFNFSRRKAPESFYKTGARQNWNIRTGLPLRATQAILRGKILLLQMFRQQPQYFFSICTAGSEEWPRS